MMPKNEKEALIWLQKLVEKVLPKITRQSDSQLRMGIIRGINSNNNTASVEVFGSGQSLGSVPYPPAFNPKVGQKCLLATPDVKLISQNFIIGVVGNG